MNSLVLDLQKEIIDAKKPVSQTLQKAYLLARKLKAKELINWIEKELNGSFENAKYIPEYRNNIQGTLEAWNAYHGWQPVLITDKKIEKQITRWHIRNPISSIEDLVKAGRGASNLLSDSFAQLFNHQTKTRLCISETQLKIILDMVRNTLLNWLIKLEEDGILGEDFLITADEKKIASQNLYTINNFYRSFSNSQIQQNTDNSFQEYSNNNIDSEILTDIIKNIRDHLEELSLSKIQVQDIKQHLNDLEKGCDTEKPEKAKISNALKSIKSILEGVTSNLMASGLIHEINKLISFS